MSVSLDNLEPIDVRPIKRALISVYDKTGLEDLARALGEAGVEIVSTGSTAARIAAAGVAVTPVDDVTGFPEVLEGRVKTLHPFIHSGILADQRKAAHREQIAQLGIKAFDLVVCNLYPFQDTVASGASFDECVEQIDIGGPSMVRAAAKNHPSVAVVTSPERYADVAQAVAGEGFTLEQRRALAAEAFAHTATYDLAIAGWFADELDLEDVREALDEAAESHLDASDAAFLESLGYQAEEDYVVEAAEEDGQASGMPVFVADAFERVESLRYGENPHQGAAVYREIDESFEDEVADDEALVPGIANARQLHGKAMSYTTTRTATRPCAPPTIMSAPAWRSSSTRTPAASLWRTTWPRRTAWRTPATRCRRSARDRREPPGERGAGSPDRPDLHRGRAGSRLRGGRARGAEREEEPACPAGGAPGSRLVRVQADQRRPVGPGARRY